MVRKSYGPNKYVQTIQGGSNSLSIEHGGASQGDDVLMAVRCTVFEVSVEAVDDF